VSVHSSVCGDIGKDFASRHHQRPSLALAAVLLIVFVASHSAARAQTPSSSAGKPAAGHAAPLVGTWTLVSADGHPTAGGHSPIGLLVVDPDGFVGLAVMDGGRQKYSSSEPTPAEAKATFDSFRSLFGTCRVDQADSTMTLHLDGSLDPNATDSHQTLAFALTGNRLRLTPRSPTTQLRGSLVWERLPDLKELTPTHRRLIGFWKLVPNEGEKAEPGSAQAERRGYIIYTTAGYMAVHIMPGTRAKYAGASPTPEEAKAAMRGYTSYFGPFQVNEQDRYVVHQRVAHTIPASTGTNAQRFYEFVGKRLVLRLLSTSFTVPTTLHAAKSEGREPSMITWERISAYDQANGNR